MPRPKGSKNKGNRREVRLSELENLLDPTEVPDGDTDDEDSSDNVVLIDKDGCYGFKTYKYGYELHFRRRYEHDTAVETRNPKTKETRTVIYNSGDYAPWQLAPRPYHTTMSHLLVAAKRLMIKDGISMEQDISSLVEVIEKSEKRILGIVHEH